MNHERQDEIDITGDLCPLTFVKVKLRLERMTPGAVLRVRLRGEEPLINVPRTLRDEGYRVSEAEADGEDFWLTVVKPE